MPFYVTLFTESVSLSLFLYYENYRKPWPVLTVKQLSPYHRSILLISPCLYFAVFHALYLSVFCLLLIYYIPVMYPISFILCVPSHLHFVVPPLSFCGAYILSSSHLFRQFHRNIFYNWMTINVWLLGVLYTFDLCVSTLCALYHRLCISSYRNDYLTLLINY